jgi:hypothetical protein
VWGVISKYLLLQLLHFPTTLPSLLRSLPCQAANVAACPRYGCGEKKCKSTLLHIFISFCFGDDGSEFDGKGGGNNNGNGYGNDLSLSVL